MSSSDIVFEKMHGLGNDFMLIDKRHQHFEITPKLVQSLADRHTGIGFDQLLLLGESEHDHCDAAYRFFNPDGSEAEQCGNGQRCLSYYLHMKKPSQTTFCLSGPAGDIYSTVDNDQVRVNMGQIRSIDALSINGKHCYQVLFGNPHLVTIESSIDDCDLIGLNHTLTQSFHEGINLEVVEKMDDHCIKIRVHERGTGETLACGSGACAAAFAMLHAGEVTKDVKVMLPGGDLMVEYDKADNIYLKGAAAHVFTGKIRL